MNSRVPEPYMDEIFHVPQVCFPFFYKKFSCVDDRYRFDADPDSDPTFHFDADPDPYPCPTPCWKIRIFLFTVSASFLLSSTSFKYFGHDFFEISQISLVYLYIRLKWIRIRISMPWIRIRLMMTIRPDSDHEY